VNPFTSLLVSAHQDELLAQAAAERLARAASQPGRPNPIARKARSVWSFLAASADRPATVPKLTDYPFRS
jgi:hypothetical protein